MQMSYAAKADFVVNTFCDLTRQHGFAHLWSARINCDHPFSCFLFLAVNGRLSHEYTTRKSFLLRQTVMTEGNPVKAKK